MTNKLKKIITWIIAIPLSVVIIYLTFFTISVIPAVLLSPAIIYDLIKNPNSWHNISLYYKLVIMFSTTILTGTVLKELFNFFIWIKNKFIN